MLRWHPGLALLGLGFVACEHETQSAPVTPRPSATAAASAEVAPPLDKATAREAGARPTPEERGFAWSDPPPPGVPTTGERGLLMKGGPMPADVVRRVVRQNFGRFRSCYEQGVRKDEALAGRVAFEFAIDTSGHVTRASGDGSDLPDPVAVACMLDALARLSFPAPPSPVEIIYPLHFSPGT